MNLFLTGAVTLGGIILFALGGLLIARRCVRDDDPDAHRNSAGYTMAVIGTVYGVVLALVVAEVWSDYKRAGAYADQEAGAVIALHRQSQHLPPALANTMTSYLRSYAEAVISREWPALSRGDSTAVSSSLLDRMSIAIGGIRADTGRGQVLFGDLLARMHELEESRTHRIHAARTRLHRLVWFLVLAGAMATITCTWLFRLKRTVIHATLVVLLAGVLGLNIFFIQSLQHPFNPAAGHQPSAMREALALISEPAPTDGGGAG